MSRSLGLVVLTLCLSGCQGQSNPFMRTTVPPPATGAGAPTDPYYNNSGRSQPPAAASTAVPGAAPVAPVVPPPDKRFTQPGGFNFPQGSVLHRKAVDPKSDEFRTGATSIARAARPRSQISGDGETLVAKTEATPEPADAETPDAEESNVVQTSAAEPQAAEVADQVGEEAEEANVALASSEPASEPAAPSEPAEIAMEASPASAAATVRIVADASPDSSASDVSTLPSDSNSPFKAVAKTSTSLTVAPPTASSTAPSDTTMAAVAADAPDDASGRARFYFDRKHDVRPSAKAQPVAYLGSAANDVAFAGGPAGNGGVEGQPDGASAYSHHRQYQWLRGKLEYSTVARRWKLRYIPIDGTTDQFGGSVVLPSSPLLEGMHAGDMVTVKGTIGDTPAEHGRFAPLYQLSAVERQ